MNGDDKKSGLRSTADKTIKTTWNAATSVVGKVTQAGKFFSGGLFHAIHHKVAPSEPVKPGSVPGIESLGDLTQPPEPGTIQIQCLDYGPELHQVREIDDLDALLDESRPVGANVRWINVNGLHPYVVDHIRRKFDIHTLAAEDVLRTHQRPKLEPFDQYLFIIVRMLTMPEHRLVEEQISFFLFDGLLITFQERPGDVWDPVRKRIEKAGTRIRTLGESYLFYALLDAIVDNCFPILEQFGNHLDALEKEVLGNPKPTVQQSILAAKRDLALLRRVIWPLREIASELHAEKNEDIIPAVKEFMRDVYDHTIQVMEILETYREMAGGLNDLYMSVVSNRMNEIMKVLTIMASFFIPITFVAGVYGMNFDNIPELHWKYSYAVFWAICIAMTLGLAWYFYRKGWIGKK